MNIETNFKVRQDAAYLEGQKAYLGGARVALADNPYPYGTPEHRSWAAGYTACYEDDCE